MKIHTKGQSDLTKKASPVRRNAFRSFTTLTPFTSTCLYNRLTLFLKVHSRFHELFITLYDSNIMKLRVCGRFLDHPNHHMWLAFTRLSHPARQVKLKTQYEHRCWQQKVANSDIFSTQCVYSSAVLSFITTSIMLWWLWLRTIPNTNLYKCIRTYK